MNKIFTILFLCFAICATAQRTSLLKGIQKSPSPNMVGITNANNEQVYRSKVYVDSLYQIGKLDTAYVNVGDSLVIINVYGDTVYFEGGSGGGVSVCIGGLFEGYVGDNVSSAETVTNFTLVDPSLYTDDELESKYIVDRNGLILRYNPTPLLISEYKIDFGTQEIKLNSSYPLLMVETLGIRSGCDEPTGNYQEFTGDGIVFVFNVTNFPLIDPALYSDDELDAKYISDMNGLILHYDSSPSAVSEYAINYATQEIELQNPLPLGQTIAIRSR